MEFNELLNSLKKRWQSILALTCLFAGTAALVCLFLLPPSYQAFTTVMVVPKDFFQQDSLMQYSDILTAHYQLAQMYQEIAQSRSVTEKVIELEKLKETPKEFKERVSICRLSNTELIQIRVEDKDPYRAQKTANTLTHVFMENVVKIMKVDSLILVEEASWPEEPLDKKIAYKIVVAGVIGFLIAISKIILFLCLDSTIKNSEVVAVYLELPVLGEIPKNHCGIHGYLMGGEGNERGI